MPICKHKQDGEKQEDMNTCRAVISLASQRPGGMAAMTEVLELKDTGSLGRTGRGYKEGVLPSMSMTSWSVWSSVCGWMRS